MNKLNIVLLIILTFLLLFVCLDTVFSDSRGDMKSYSVQQGQGSISVSDNSPTEENYYSDDSNTGSVDSGDNNDEDPLDEEYYGDDGSNSNVVDLGKHETGNPLLLFLCALVMGIGCYKK